MPNNKPLAVKLYVGLKNVWGEKSESDFYLHLTVYSLSYNDQYCVCVLDTCVP